MRLDVHEVAEELERVASRRLMRRFERNVAKARAKDSLRALDRLTHTVDGEPRIISDPPDRPGRGASGRAPGDGRARASGAPARLPTVPRARPAAARRRLPVRSHGSQGRRGGQRRHPRLGLLVGRDDDDPLFLQFKEADPLLEPYAGASRYENHGERVVRGQRLMQAASDIFLGWLPAVGMDGRPRDFYGRQLWDGKRSVEIESLDAKASKSTRGRAASRWLALMPDPGTASRSPPTSAR